MTSDKHRPEAGGSRSEATRGRVLDAAERLLRDGKADFSMRDLAAAAGVSFATPFNQFGNKTAIMHALSSRRIDTMVERVTKMFQPASASERVAVAVEIAVAVMLEEPGVNRAVMSWIGTAGPKPGQVLERSTALWELALGEEDAVPELPRQLAVAFRGALSFWTAGELSDAELASTAGTVAAALMKGVER